MKFTRYTPFSSLRTWFRPRLGQPPVFPLLLLAGLLSVTAVLNARHLYLGAVPVSLSLPGFARMDIQPYNLKMHPSPVTVDRSFVTVHPDSSESITVYVPVNILTWIDSGIAVLPHRDHTVMLSRRGCWSISLIDVLRFQSNAHLATWTDCEAYP